MTSTGGTGAGGDTPQTDSYLDLNYPNPFNPATAIRYRIAERGHVSLRIFNASGQLVRTLVDEVRAPGVEHSVTWNGVNDAGQPVASGVYFCRLVTTNYTQTRKMILLK